MQRLEELYRQRVVEITFHRLHHALKESEIFLCSLGIRIANDTVHNDGSARYCTRRKKSVQSTLTRREVQDVSTSVDVCPLSQTLQQIPCRPYTSRCTILEIIRSSSR